MFSLEVQGEEGPLTPILTTTTTVRGQRDVPRIPGSWDSQMWQSNLILVT